MMAEQWAGKLVSPMVDRLVGSRELMLAVAKVVSLAESKVVVMDNQSAV
jgi:hypothetical protein